MESNEMLSRRFYNWCAEGEIDIDSAPEIEEILFGRNDDGRIDHITVVFKTDGGVQMTIYEDDPMYCEFSIPYYEIATKQIMTLTREYTDFLHEILYCGEAIFDYINE